MTDIIEVDNHRNRDGLHDICIIRRNGRSKYWYLLEEDMISYHKKTDVYTLWEFGSCNEVLEEATEEEAMLYWFSLGGTSWES